MTSCGKAKEAAKSGADAAKEAVEKTGDAVKEAAEKTEEVVKEGAEAVKEGAEKVADATKEALSPKVAKGKKLFTEKTCATCHAADKKLVGPSIKDIAAKYAEKNGNIVQFLKGKAAPIVDTDPGQVAVMKANIDGFLKDVSAEDLQALAAYMRSVK
ncbi:MAG TPA: c-type cytochrome [Flavobacteriia bacterium]|nr:c-type cytochrome [Flavobacteriia bacterium]